MIELEDLADGDRVRLHPNSENRLHSKPVTATFADGYFFCDGTDPMEGPDYYVGDVMRYIDRIEVIND